MNKLSNHLADICVGVGVILTVAGTYMLNKPASAILAGIELFIIAYVLARGEE